MMFWSVVYAVGVCALAYALAALAERVLRGFGFPARGAWLAAMAASVTLSVTRVATDYLPFEFALAARARDAAVEHSAARLAAAVELAAPLDGVLIFAWWSSILAAAIVGLLAWWALTRERSRWAPTRFGATRVLVSSNTGPATVGLRGAIVVPGWFTGLPAEQQDLILAHEREHVSSWDQGMWGIGLLLLLMMPWNPMLWAQLIGLRRAIEVDCDLRVVRAHPADAQRYARTLLEMGERFAMRDCFALSFLGAWSLEARIRQLVAPRRLSLRRVIATLAICGATLLALLSVPNPIQLGCAAQKAAAPPQGATVASCSRVVVGG